MLATGALKKWLILIGSASLLAAAAIIILVAALSSSSNSTSSSSTSDTPVNTVLPTIRGYTTPKSRLYSTNGTWTGGPMTYSYRWQDCNSSGTSCRNATGAASGPCSPTAYCYVVTSGEASSGNTIKVVVTATNSSGSIPATAAYVGPASTSEAVPCALTHAAGADGTNSCWATHTGVQGATGYPEAQIEAGAPGFTHVSSNVTITQPGTVIDHEWISGCVAINSGANNVTIKDSLITPPDGDYCHGNVGDPHASAINDGAGSSAPTGLLVEDTTVDGGNATGDQYGISMIHGTCLRCNVFGFAKNYLSFGNTAANPTLFEDSYSHDISPHDESSHVNGFWIDFAASYVTIKHSYAIMTQAVDVSAAIAVQSDGGAGSYVTVDSSYAEGDGGVDMTEGSAQPNAVFTHNALSSDNGYSGTEYANGYCASGTGNVWIGNYVPETSALFGAPGGC